MRQQLGVSKVQQLIKKTGLPIVKVFVRGNTNHRKDLCLKSGEIICLYKDGVMEKSSITWK